MNFQELTNFKRKKIDKKHKKNSTILCHFETKETILMINAKQFLNCGMFGFKNKTNSQLFEVIANGQECHTHCNGTSKSKNQ